MNSPARSPDESVLDEVAAEWLFERESGFTVEREQAFAAWCAEDPRHAEAVRRVESTLELLGEMPAVRSQLEARLNSGSAAIEPHAARRFPTMGRWSWIGGLAAAIAVGFAVWQWQVDAPVSPIEHYTTDDLVQRSLALSDGSVMDVDVDSEVAVQFSARARRITLQRGAAHFQVAHDPARPFIVAAGDVSVQAVGTAFEVRLTSSAVDVVVVEGKVELLRHGAESLPATPGKLPLLLAGQRAQVDRSEADLPARIETIDAASIRSRLAWETPMTSFTDVPLRDVIARFNRRNATQLILEDPELGQRKIGGTIALDQVDAFVRLLEQDGDIVADRSSAGRIALRPAH